jgi:hypothetical protein
MRRELGGTAGAAEDPAQLQRRAAKVLLAVGVAYASLVGTHGGEFWPFSVFPMFSKAGRPWARAVVRANPAGFTEEEIAATYSPAALPGTAVALVEHGIPQNDLSSLAQRAERWGATELETARQLFGSLPCEQPLLLLRVRGALAAEGVDQVATPLASLGCNDAKVDVRVAPFSRAALPQ